MELKITQLAQNKGQIAGLPANPRQWKKADVERLAQSIEETPELLDARPLIVIQQDDKYIVLGGNLRLAALKHLGRKTAPVYVIPEDIPIEKQKEIVIKDNGAFGAWDFDMLANEWDDLPLTDWGVPTWENDQPDDEIPDNLDAEGKEKDFVLKITFPDADKMTSFVMAYKDVLEKDYGCTMSESGGAL